MDCGSKCVDRGTLNTGAHNGDSPSPPAGAETGTHSIDAPRLQKKHSELRRLAPPSPQQKSNGAPDGGHQSSRGLQGMDSAAAAAAAVTASASAAWRFEARLQSLEAQLQGMARCSSQYKVLMRTWRPQWPQPVAYLLPPFYAWS